MRNRRELLTLAIGIAPGWFLPAQDKVDFVCPMDPDVHKNGPGRCPRCGMALVADLPSFNEYPVNISTVPAVPQAGHPLTLRFIIQHPRKREVWRKFTEVHEKLFHLFLVSEDLRFFAHEHPVQEADGSFSLRTVLPHAGLFRVLCDFYPSDGQPQMVARTLLIPGTPPQLTPLATDGAPQWALNVEVRLATEPTQILAGKETLLFFSVAPPERLEPYLGAWGHLLVASADLIDMIHTHPFIADGGPQLQFNVIFPRPGKYRLWLQVQKESVVNTTAFTLSVDAL